MGQYCDASKPVLTEAQKRLRNIRKKLRELHGKPGNEARIAELKQEEAAAIAEAGEEDLAGKDAISTDAGKKRKKKTAPNKKKLSKNADGHGASSTMFFSIAIVGVVIAVV